MRVFMKMIAETDDTLNWKAIQRRNEATARKKANEVETGRVGSDINNKRVNQKEETDREGKAEQSTRKGSKRERERAAGMSDNEIERKKWRERKRNSVRKSVIQKKREKETNEKAK